MRKIKFQIISLSSKRFYFVDVPYFQKNGECKNVLTKNRPHCKSGRHDSFMFFLLCVDFVVVACVLTQFQVTTYIRAKKPLTCLHKLTHAHTPIQLQREQKTCTAFYATTIHSTQYVVVRVRVYVCEYLPQANWMDVERNVPCCYSVRV